LKYDKLVVSVGSINNTFGVKGVTEYCNFLKNVSDAIKIKEKILDCFEKASLKGVSEEERKRLLHFVIVGGGPTVSQ
jgi:NADH:ubiquinone reductase (non-electrogenic)